MRALIVAKAEVNKQDWDNYSPLHFCAASGFIEGAKELLDEGAAINIQTRLKETPLTIAIIHRQIEMVKFLIDSHADVQKTALRHRSPLFFVSDVEIVDLLVGAGAGVNNPDDQGLTPLHNVSQNGLADIAGALIRHGANVNATDSNRQTPLHVAASNGQVNVVKILLESGADVKALDNARRSPEMLARRNDHLNVSSLISSFHDQIDDDDAPPLGFKAFTGIRHTNKPPPGTEIDISADELKFNIPE